MPLSKGDAAPDFTLYDDSGTLWTLSEHRGEHVVLLFFPGAFTSVCTTEMNTVNNDPDYDGATVAGISTDSPAVLAEFKAANGLGLTLLSDHHARVAASYGALFSTAEHRLGFDRVAKRAAFVVNPDGDIAYAEVLENAGNQPDFDAIKDALMPEVA